jgi:SAM-dependent methyltransferase
VVSLTCNVCRTQFASSEHRLFEKNGFWIVRCPECTLVFRETLPGADDLAEIYGPAYFGGPAARTTSEGYLDYVADESVHRANARRRLARIERHLPAGRLLDVGCAAGFFVDEAALRGWEAHGIDVSATMVEEARRRTLADVRLGTLRETAPEGPFACVTMWDYLEHSPDPRRDVERAFELLAPGGLLALSTGDVASAVARISLERWHLMTPRHHNYFFDARTLTRLLSSVGFDVLEVMRPAAVYPLAYLAHKARLVVPLAPVAATARRLARSRLGRLAMPMNLWDVMTVLARRPAGS